MLRAIVILISTFFVLSAFAQDLMSQRIMPWSARFLMTQDPSWSDQSILERWGPEGRALYDQAANLKLRKKLRCGQNSSILETSLPSLGNKLITTRFRHDPVSNKMTLDVFVKEGETYREILRSSYDVYRGPENYGRLREVSLFDIASQNRIRMGAVNQEILTFFNRTLGGTATRVEVNSPLGRDFFNLLNNTERGFVCCFNRQCRQHLDATTAPPPPADTRRAEAATE